MLLFFAVCFLGAAVYLVGEVTTAPTRERRVGIRRAREYGLVQVRGTQMPRFHERVITPALQRLANLAFRMNPRITKEMISARLLAAGLGRRISPTSFLAAKAGLSAGGAVVGLVFGAALGRAMPALAFALVLAAGGLIAPGIFVSMKTRSRRDEIRIQLPDALDLLAVSVEAGLGFDGSIVKLTEHTEGALAEEFSLTLNEMRIGESRQEALKKLADRAAAPELGQFCRAIIQADQLGISLGRILRVQATDQRNRRQAAAEEKAMKAPIKMLFPLVLFIFPAMFIVVLGPAFLNLAKIF